MRNDVSKDDCSPRSGRPLKLKRGETLCIAIPNAQQLGHVSYDYVYTAAHDVDVFVIKAAMRSSSSEPSLNRIAPSYGPPSYGQTAHPAHYNAISHMGYPYNVHYASRPTAYPMYPPFARQGLLSGWPRKYVNAKEFVPRSASNVVENTQESMAAGDCNIKNEDDREPEPPKQLSKRELRLQRMQDAARLAREESDRSTSPVYIDNDQPTAAAMPSTAGAEDLGSGADIWIETTKTSIVNGADVSQNARPLDALEGIGSMPAEIDEEFFKTGEGFTEHSAFAEVLKESTEQGDEVVDERLDYEEKKNIKTEAAAQEADVVRERLAHSEAPPNAPQFVPNGAVSQRDGVMFRIGEKNATFFSAPSSTFRMADTEMPILEDYGMNLPTAASEVMKTHFEQMIVDVVVENASPQTVKEVAPRAIPIEVVPQAPVAAKEQPKKPFGADFHFAPASEPPVKSEQVGKPFGADFAMPPSEESARSPANVPTSPGADFMRSAAQNSPTPYPYPSKPAEPPRPIPVQEKKTFGADFFAISSGRAPPPNALPQVSNAAKSGPTMFRTDNQSSFAATKTPATFLRAPEVSPYRQHEERLTKAAVVTDPNEWDSWETKYGAPVPQSPMRPIPSEPSQRAAAPPPPPMVQKVLPKPTTAVKKDEETSDLMLSAGRALSRISFDDGEDLKLKNGAMTIHRKEEPKVYSGRMPTAAEAKWVTMHVALEDINPNLSEAEFFTRFYAWKRTVESHVKNAFCVACGRQGHRPDGCIFREKK